MKNIKLKVVPSTQRPDLLSIRLADDEDYASFKHALVAAGYKAGDTVYLVVSTLGPVA